MKKLIWYASCIVLLIIVGAYKMLRFWNETKEIDHLSVEHFSEVVTEVTAPNPMGLVKPQAHNMIRRPPKLPTTFVPLSQAEVYGVKKFVFFIGYPRSGHSIIGSFMDAHPNMVIAHEYHLFENLGKKKMTKYDIFNDLYKSSYDQLVGGWRGKQNIKNKGYSLAIEGLWQASFDKLKVIGNKQGGTTVQLFRRSPQVFLSTLKYLVSVINIPVCVLHVVRNPFDMIATQTLYMHTGIKGVKIEASEDKKYNNSNLLAATARDMMERANAVNKIISKIKLPILQIHHEDFIKDPLSAMKSVCTFIGVDCPRYYLDMCKNNTYTSYSKSRNTVVWTHSVLDLIREQLGNFSFFQRYSFEQ